MKLKRKDCTVGVIGAGVSGVVTALELNKNGIRSIVFEQHKSVVNGPPFCHLHAGGNLYPDISIEQCTTLLKQSIEMARLFPQSIDERPTFISIPKTEKYTTEQITKRLDEIVKSYQELIQQDPENKILGEPKSYYRVYKKQDLEQLQNKGFTKFPTSPDEWMANSLQVVALEKLKLPIILVEEYGWNLFRLGAQAQIALQNSAFTNLLLETQVIDVKDLRESNSEYNWEIITNNGSYQVHYLVNSCGYKTGEIDKAIQVDTERLIEFKAAYISKWQPIDGLLPELIFHGERGTPHGMAQLTPYCDNHYQIHGMTEQITLFKDGLVEATEDETQPEFDYNLKSKLEDGWSKENIRERTTNAINYVANFVPKFTMAEVAGPPLFGAQQIPGDDPSLRVGEVSFSTNFYARSEIVKASSALTVARQILSNLAKHHLIDPIDHKTLENPLLNQVTKEEISNVAKQFARERGYPEALASLVIDK